MYFLKTLITYVLTISVVEGLYENEADISLEFRPPKTFYVLKAGDHMPDIKCTADCIAPCFVTWGEVSSNQILSLGIVSASHSGEYVCAVKPVNNGTFRAVERRIYVFVKDDTNERASFAALIGLQVLTVAFFGIFAVYFCLLSKGFACTRCSLTEFKQKEKKPSFVEVSSTEQTARESNAGVHHNNAYIEDYETLNAGTRQFSSDSENYSALRIGEA